MSVEKMMTEGLPLNRKERYYTGTVLPLIVCAENFALFDRLTDLIDGYTKQPIDWTPSNANVQFFTEYSFVESVFGSSRARFATPPTSKDTPDVMILIRGRKTVLIAIEAKMFHNPLRDELERQVRAQRVILDYLRSAIGIDEVHHLALLPEKLARAVGPLSVPVITWEQIYEAFTRGRQEDYFLAVLRVAISSYDDLVSKSSMGNFGANSERKMSGAEIVRLHRSGAGPRVMGRNKGLLGPVVEEDLRTGKWRAQIYETRSEGEPPNRNWFLVSDFVTRLPE